MSMFDDVNYGDNPTYDDSDWYAGNAGASPQPDPSGGYTPDQNGGFWDSQGGYYDAGGGYFSPDGSYTDAQGNAYQPGQDGNYQLVGNGGGGGLGGALGGLGNLLKQGGAGIQDFYKNNPLLGTLLNFGAGKALDNYDQGRFDARQNQLRGDQQGRVAAARAEKPKYAIAPGALAAQVSPQTAGGNYGRAPGGEQLMFNQANPLALLSGYDTRPGAMAGNTGLVPPVGQSGMGYAGGSPTFNESGGPVIGTDASLPSGPGATGLPTPKPLAPGATNGLVGFGGGARSGALAYAGGGGVTGPGGGQDDRVPALLSNGEYVMDAATVSDLGDGSNGEGARKLDAMRQKIRTHKRTGKFPPLAKQPHQYLGK